LHPELSKNEIQRDKQTTLLRECIFIVVKWGVGSFRGGLGTKNTGAGGLGASREREGCTVTRRVWRGGPTGG